MNAPPFAISAVAAQQSRGTNIIPFPSPSGASSPFDGLMYQLVMKSHREGNLPPAMLEFFLVGLGIEP